MKGKIEIALLITSIVVIASLLLLLFDRNTTVSKLQDHIDQLEHEIEVINRVESIVGNELIDTFSFLAPKQNSTESKTLWIILHDKVCSSSMTEGLDLVVKNRYDLRDQNIKLKLLVGYQSRRDAEIATTYLNYGIDSDEIVFVDIELLYDSLPVMVEGDYIDTPIYLMTDNTDKIVSSFKTSRFSKYRVGEWLSNFII